MASEEVEHYGAAHSPCHEGIAGPIWFALQALAWKAQVGAKKPLGQILITQRYRRSQRVDGAPTPLEFKAEFVGVSN